MDDTLKNIDISRKNKVFFNSKSPYVSIFSSISPYFTLISKEIFSPCFRLISRFSEKKRKITYCINVENTRFFTSKSQYIHFFHQIRIIEKNHHFFANVKKTCFLSNFRKPIYTVNGEKY